jgi:hypothetical protein
MKILAFVDVHGSLSALKKIRKKAKSSDIIVCAGDISIFEQHLNKIIAMLDKLGKQVLIIPGNHETEQLMKSTCKKTKNVTYLHEKTFEIDNFLFIGYGGGGFALVDSHFKQIAKQFKRKIKKGQKLILVTHAPPYGTKVDKIMEQHCGNKTLKQFIVKTKPELVICGHLHETAGIEDKISKTLIINPGPYGRIITI